MSLIDHIWPWSRLRRLERDVWALKEACGYSIPRGLPRHVTVALVGAGGNNPFQCGICEAGKRYPRLHAANLLKMAERIGGNVYSPRNPLTAAQAKRLTDMMPLNAEDFPSPIQDQ